MKYLFGFTNLVIIVAYLSQYHAHPLTERSLLRQDAVVDSHESHLVRRQRRSKSRNSLSRSNQDDEEDDEEEDDEKDDRDKDNDDKSRLRTRKGGLSKGRKRKSARNPLRRTSRTGRKSRGIDKKEDSDDSNGKDEEDNGKHDNDERGNGKDEDDKRGNGKDDDERDKDEDNDDERDKDEGTQVGEDDDDSKKSKTKSGSKVLKSSIGSTKENDSGVIDLGSILSKINELVATFNNNMKAHKDNFHQQLSTVLILLEYLSKGISQLEAIDKSTPSTDFNAQLSTLQSKTVNLQTITNTITSEDNFQKGATRSNDDAIMSTQIADKMKTVSEQLKKLKKD